MQAAHSAQTHTCGFCESPTFIHEKACAYCVHNRVLGGSQDEGTGNVVYHSFIVPGLGSLASFTHPLLFRPPTHFRPHIWKPKGKGTPFLSESQSAFVAKQGPKHPEWQMLTALGNKAETRLKPVFRGGADRTRFLGV